MFDKIRSMWPFVLKTTMAKELKAHKEAFNECEMRRIRLGLKHAEAVAARQRAEQSERRAVELFKYLERRGMFDPSRIIFDRDGDSYEAMSHVSHLGSLSFVSCVPSYLGGCEISDCLTDLSEQDSLRFGVRCNETKRVAVSFTASQDHPAELIAREVGAKVSLGVYRELNRQRALMGDDA